MNSKAKRPLALLIALLVAIFVCMGAANSIQRDGGRVSVEMGSISTQLGDLTYKLYKPDSATADTPAPAVQPWPYSSNASTTAPRRASSTA